MQAFDLTRPVTGFGADPFLTGVAAAETIKGIQDNGVQACAKHLYVFLLSPLELPHRSPNYSIGNEQEHYRGGSMARQSK